MINSKTRSIASFFYKDLVSSVTLFCIVFVFFYLSIIQTSQAFTIDEAAFPYAALGVTNSGIPEFYNGETRPNDMGLWHPPLYTYLLAAFIEFFGFSEFSVRFFGILLVFLSFLVLAYTTSKFIKNFSVFYITILAGLFLLNPLVISGALVPDIDGTLGILSFSILMFTVSYIYKSEQLKKIYFILSLAFLLLFWTKFTIVLLALPIVLFAVLLSPKNKISKLLVAFSSLFSGLLLFFFSYFLLSLLPGFVFTGPFDYFFGSVGSRQGSLGIESFSIITDRLFLGPGSVIYWVTPATLLAALVGLFYMVYKRNGQHKFGYIYLFSSTISLFGYAYITSAPFGFPKYWGITVVSLSMLIVFSFRGEINLQKTKNIFIACSLLIVVLFLFFWFSYPAVSRETFIFGRNLGLLFGITLLSWAVFFVFLFFLQRFLGSNFHIPKIFFSIVIVSIILTTLLSLVNARAQYSTRYYFSEVGIEKVINFFNDKDPQKNLLLTPKDVGIQSGIPFIEDSQWIFNDPVELSTLIESSEITYLVTRNKWDYSEPSFPEQFLVFKDKFRPIAKQPSVDFIIWERIEGVVIG